MKIGFCTNAFGHEQETMERVLPFLADSGYDALEFWVQYLVRADLVWLRETTDELGLGIEQICPYFNWTTSARSYERSLRDAETWLRYAVDLACPHIRAYAGRVASAEATSDDWRACTSGIQQLCDLAADCGVSVLIETHQAAHGGPTLADTSANVLRLLDAIDRANCAVNLQTPLIGETPIESAKALGGAVKHIHAHNWFARNDPDGTLRLELTPLASGEVDFDAFLGKLVDAGFEGCVSVEHANIHSDPYGAAVSEAIYLRHVRKQLFDPDQP